MAQQLAVVRELLFVDLIRCGGFRRCLQPESISAPRSEGRTLSIVLRQSRNDWRMHGQRDSTVNGATVMAAARLGHTDNQIRRET